MFCLKARLTIFSGLNSSPGLIITSRTKRLDFTYWKKGSSESLRPTLPPLGSRISSLERLALDCSTLGLPILSASSQRSGGSSLCPLFSCTSEVLLGTGNLRRTSYSAVNSGYIDRCYFIQADVCSGSPFVASIIHGLQKRFDEVKFFLFHRVSGFFLVPRKVRERFIKLRVVQ